jgi:hypothetical protein
MTRIQRLRLRSMGIRSLHSFTVELILHGSVILTFHFIMLALGA